ncbi:ribonuclease HII [archaeon]|jgi:ribonuclease HII|nr:ribonuclease HII [archaeon]
MTELNLGIDDAGRGPVIGPMVLGGCVLDKETERELTKLGVKDSKQLTQKRREFLEAIIKEKAISWAVQLASPDLIDTSKHEGLKLNELEAVMSAKVIDEINKKDKKIKAVLDCPSTSIVNWRNYLMNQIKYLKNLDISCEHKADQNHVSVAAASILAKCERERQMGILKEEYGEEIGSGYPSDPLTKQFLKKYAEKYADKGIFRKTWATYTKAMEQFVQTTL